MSATAQPPSFLRKLRSLERDDASSWLVPCPDKHSSDGFAVLVRADERSGRYRFECLEARYGDICGNERDLIRLLEIEESETRIALAETTVSFVTVADFIAQPVLQAAPIVVDGNGATALAADGFTLVYGDGGAGKTTTFLDAALHFAAGIPWLDLLTPTRALQVGWVENEGPQEEFRRKLERKHAAWRDRVPAGGFHVLAAPWGALDLRVAEHRAGIAAAVREHDLDLLFLGPLNDLGMEGGGTPPEVKAFHDHLRDVQSLADRLVSLALLHHENMAGGVSGAWKGRPDLLVHVTAQGNGKTRVHWQKAKWSSSLHGTTSHLRWAEHEGFELEPDAAPRPERVWDDIAAYVLAHGGTSWRPVETAVTGGGPYLRQRRDRMLEAGLLINAGGPGGMQLWHRDDPVRPSLDIGVSDEGHAADTPSVLTGDGGAVGKRVRVSRPCRDTQDTDTLPPARSPASDDSETGGET